MTLSYTQQKSPLKTPLLRSPGEGKMNRPKAAMVIPAANVDETKSEYILSIASPGFKREDFRVMIEKDIISITAAKEVAPENCIHGRCEYDYNNWKRTFSLPDDADALMTRARYREGELIIRIPRGKADKLPGIITIYVY